MSAPLADGTKVVFIAPYVSNRKGTVKRSYNAGGFIGYEILDDYQTTWRLGEHNVKQRVSVEAKQD